MSTHDPEVIVIGAGPNGLSAACVLARAGLRVVVLESRSDRPGGALASESATREGFVHDVGAAFFPFLRASPAFADLDLGRHGLEWVRAPVDSAHPAPDGTCSILAEDEDRMAANFGDPRDGERWVKLMRWHRGIEADLLGAMLGPLPTLRPMLKLLPFSAMRLARIFMSSGAGLARRLFRSAAARRLIPGLTLHTDAGPEDTFGAGIGYMLATTGVTGGYVIPLGGAGAITAALTRCLESYGGSIRLDARVERIVVRNRRAEAVVLANGQEIRATRAVMANTSAPGLFLDLVERAEIPGRIQRKMEGFVQGWGTFKVDWALGRPVPWADAQSKEAAVVHAGDSLDDLCRFTKQVRSGALPDNPYLVIGQQSLFDNQRAPEGQHTLWAYSRVPPRVQGGWSAHAQHFADRIDQRIEGLAPGFRKSILARREVSPEALEAMDANLRGGDLGGGSAAWHRQLIFKPVFPYFRYKTPVRGLYLCSSYTHPGAGVHGMCGYNAAQVALRELG